MLSRRSRVVWATHANLEKMNRIIVAFLLLLSFSACGGGAPANPVAPSPLPSNPTPTPPPAPPPPEPTPTTGQVVFWTDATRGWSSITIWLGKTLSFLNRWEVGTLTESLHSAPHGCTINDGARVVATEPAGTYYMTAETDRGNGWLHPVEIQAGECTVIGLSCLDGDCLLDPNPPTPPTPTPTPTPQPTPTPPPPTEETPRPPPPPSPGPPEGKVVFWTDARLGWSSIDIRFTPGDFRRGSGPIIGTLTRLLNGPPANCNVSGGGVVVATGYGGYSYQGLIDSEHVAWTGSLTIRNGQCEMIKLSCPNRDCRSKTPPPPVSAAECISPLDSELSGGRVSYDVRFRNACSFGVWVKVAASLYVNGIRQGFDLRTEWWHPNTTKWLCRDVAAYPGRWCKFEDRAGRPVRVDSTDEVGWRFAWRSCRQDEWCPRPDYP